MPTTARINATAENAPSTEADSLCADIERDTNSAIGCTLATGSSGSTDFTACCNPCARPAESRLVRKTNDMVSMEGYGFCLYGTYISGPGESLSANFLSSPATPTMVMFCHRG